MERRIAIETGTAKDSFLQRQVLQEEESGRVGGQPEILNTTRDKRNIQSATGLLLEAALQMEDGTVVGAVSGMGQDRDVVDKARLGKQPAGEDRAVQACALVERVRGSCLHAVGGVDEERAVLVEYCLQEAEGEEVSTSDLRNGGKRARMTTCLLIRLSQARILSIDSICVPASSVETRTGILGCLSPVP